MSGKFENKNAGKKTLVLMLALMLLFGCVVGGTIAWLVTGTTPVTNTFVAGKIGTMTLTETTGSTYTIIPGEKINKDPVVSFTGDGDVDAYVFVEIRNGTKGQWAYNETTEQFELLQGGDVALSFAIADGWTHLQDGVFYRTVTKGNALDEVPVIKNNEIDVDAELVQTINIMYVAENADALIFEGYAIQTKIGTPAEAWAFLDP